ncbi:hypothetical protein Z517_12243 [Fonsecaea pedrosoi CBS 271.37]|uniref:Uncharacterized protein n=1 Tax=Fonsecaea pedrosoi CBS 271.37 TaxID=1442368 RepID=A0A0D2G0I0_9EURO|nr:uncharacterized protein Z517_12243 [Fonsecaea pedrosoi CBS 271.37]KIW74303.1 hypothetical protein Z517_12243 [Fonsecaea pedrosoi CBS 271.37]
MTIPCTHLLTPIPQHLIARRQRQVHDRQNALPPPHRRQARPVLSDHISNYLFNQLFDHFSYYHFVLDYYLHGNLHDNYSYVNYAVNVHNHNHHHDYHDDDNDNDDHNHYNVTHYNHDYLDNHHHHDNISTASRIISLLVGAV